MGGSFDDFIASVRPDTNREMQPSIGPALIDLALGASAGQQGTVCRVSLSTGQDLSKSGATFS